MNNVIVALILACTAFLTSRTAIAAYPERPIRLVVPVSAGGGADATIRAIGDRLSKRLGQSVIIDNKPGAGGMLGADIVAKAAPDGYTFLVGILPGHILQPSLVRLMPYDTMKDLVMVTTLTRYPVVLVVNKSVPSRTPQELVALIRANPEKYSYGTSEATSQFLMGKFVHSLGLQGKVVHVPYKGAPAQLNDTAAGLLQFGIGSLGGLKPFLDTGMLRAIGVMGENRLDALPGIPTLNDSGIPGFTFYISNSLFAPANTPRALLDRIQTEVQAVVHGDDPELKRFLASTAQEAVADPVGEAQERFRRDFEAISKIANDLGMKAQ